ncbi:MAG: PrsW family glutamic-type intramembrane protease, partial [Candidatus Saliniplasma sp.]
MVSNNTIVKWIIILAISLVPSILYSAYIRNIERWKKEPWSSIIISFTAGAMAAIVFLGISYLLYGQIMREHEYFQFLRSVSNVFIIIILLPLVGEGLKAISILSVKSELDEVEDGLIQGATAGLGFGGFANIIYLYFTFTWA